MQRTYQAWKTKYGSTFFDKAKLAEQKANPAQSLVRKLFEVKAHTFEEALAVYNLRMGWGPHKPAGEPAPCPKCGAWFYPEGSGECWHCGKIC